MLRHGAALVDPGREIRDMNALRGLLRALHPDDRQSDVAPVDFDEKLLRRKMREKIPAYDVEGKHRLAVVSREKQK
jgi:hypothetical protein